MSQGTPYRCIESIGCTASGDEDYLEYVDVGDIVYRDKKHSYRFHVVGNPMLGSFTMYDKDEIKEHLIKCSK